MLFKSIALFVSASAAAALPACPAPQQPSQPSGPTGDDKFGLIAIRSGSSIQNVGVTASKGNLLIGGKQDASCDSASDAATFYIQDGSAYLYAASATPQQLYVDRSGMGMGKTGYTTGAQPAPRSGEREGFSVDESGYLVFDGMSPKACPTTLEGGAWSIWFTDLEKPAYNEGCTGVGLRAVKTDAPVSCVYSSD